MHHPTGTGCMKAFPVVLGNKAENKHWYKRMVSDCVLHSFPAQAKNYRAVKEKQVAKS